jgi:AraC family transcriptional regulator, ethanolamine operon transcriptional activator
MRVAQPQLQTIDLLDASEQAAAQDWPALEIVQISAGGYHGHLRALEQCEVSVYFENQNRTVHKRGITDDRYCTVSYCRNVLPRARFSEYNPADHSLFFLPCGTEFDIFVPENTGTVYFLIDQALLLNKARAMNPARWESPPHGLQMLDLLDRRALNGFVDDLYVSLSGRASAGSLCPSGPLNDVMMEQVLMAMNAPFQSDANPAVEWSIRRRARAMVNLVVEYVDAKLAQNICPTISDICQDLKLSERALQYGFKESLHLSPNTYLRYRRLNKVRAQLARPVAADVTVTDVAMHWHFWHLGRFSSDYLKLFNELPSTTLRRALA